MKIGDKKYRVQWCTKFAFDEIGDHDQDRDEWAYKDFKSIDAARTFASEQRPVGWGCVTIDPMTLQSDPDAQRGEPSLVWRGDEDSQEVLDVLWRLPEGPHGAKILPPVEKLAESFSRVLTEYIGEEKMYEVARRNRAETDDRICHSHDFCDANMAMLDAFHAHLPGLEVNLENDAIIGRWSDAWDLARAQWEKTYT
jgi:hypothetical protein